MRKIYKTVEHYVKEHLLVFKHMHFRRTGKKPAEQLLVMMVDGKHYHGGMCDRFKGIVSSYAYCKQRNIGFRILYTYPFQLTDYLVPASYDWTLKSGEYSDCFRDSMIMYYRSEYGKRLLRLRTRKQIHYYGNTDFLDLLNSTGGTSYSWGGLFKELFKPSPALAARLESLKAKIGQQYNATVFRFQNMLGDFPEYKFKAIGDEDEKERLIGKCLSAVKDNMERYGSGIPMLVTSDSVTFLQKAAEIDGVFIIPGSLVHMDGGDNSRRQELAESYMKSFLDFFMIAGAQHVICVMAGHMYNTQFPAYAAKVNDVPFERIVTE